jgi:hypothetical protein
LHMDLWFHMDLRFHIDLRFRMDLLQLPHNFRLWQLSHISKLQSPMSTVHLVYVPRGSLASLGGPFYLLT